MERKFENLLSHKEKYHNVTLLKDQDFISDLRVLTTVYIDDLLKSLFPVTFVKYMGSVKGSIHGENRSTTTSEFMACVRPEYLDYSRDSIGKVFSGTFKIVYRYGNPSAISVELLLINHVRPTMQIDHLTHESKIKDIKAHNARLRKHETAGWNVSDFIGETPDHLPKVSAGMVINLMDESFKEIITGFISDVLDDLETVY